MLLAAFAHAIGMWEIKTYAKTSGVKGEFAQTLNSLSIVQIVSSEGSYRLKNTGELLLSVRTPLPNELKIANDTVYEDGKRAKIQAPELTILARLMRLDHKWLKNRFKIACSGNKKSWEVSLAPLKTAAKTYGNIGIKGAKFVQKIEIVLANGEKVTYEFFDSK